MSEVLDGKAIDGAAPGGDADAIFDKLKGWFRRDYDSAGQVKWRKEAHEDFDFEAGEQLSEDDRAILLDAKRPVVIFNRVGPFIDSVAGQEIGNRQEVQFVPRTQGAVKVNELMTSAAKWFRQECDAEDEESDAFRDMVVAGMGWTETRLDYEENPKGDPRIDHIDPLCMVWDSSAKKRNLADMRRVFHIRRDVPIDEARALCPGDENNPFEDADYHASWVDTAKDEGGDGHHVNGKTYNKDGTAAGDEADETVTMVRAQWYERVPAWLVVDPADPENILTLDKAGLDDLAQRMKLAGVAMPKTVKTMRKVYRQAYIGGVLLEIGDAPCKDHYSFQCMTGKRDRNKNTFYGMVRAMKDPARWANKWMSQTMHIMNTTAKGGIAAERGTFFDNDEQGEASWAKQDQITFLKPGALSGASGAKMIPKPVSQFPQASFELMNFAVQSLPQVTGVNVDMLGMQASASQAASLDMQRKQSAMTILQPLFDSLRRYRKRQGRLMLYLIEHYLSDGRLIKIVGPDEAQYVPLIKQPGSNEGYDVIVDQAATSASQKEATWAYLQQILPVIGKMLPPATWLALLKYSPLPTSAQEDIKKSMDEAGQQPDPEQVKRDADLKLEQDKAAAKMANDKAASEAKIQAMEREAAASIAIERERAQSQVMLKALTAPQAPTIGPDGLPMRGAPANGDTAALILGFMQEMRRDMTALAGALNAPKQLIRDPQTGEIVGIAPMGN